MKRIYGLIALAAFFFMGGNVNAQDVRLGARVDNPVAIGVRAYADGAGLSVKLYLDPHFVLEGQVNGSSGFYNWTDDGPSLTFVTLAEYNLIFPNPSWRIFIGPGLHAGSWDRYERRYYDNVEPTQGIFGIDGILGLEYLFKSIPLGLSADVKPAMNFAAETAYFPNNSVGFAARYYFGHRVKLLRTEPVK